MPSLRWWLVKGWPDDMNPHEAHCTGQHTCRIVNCRHYDILEDHGVTCQKLNWRCYFAAVKLVKTHTTILHTSSCNLVWRCCNYAEPHFKTLCGCCCWWLRTGTTLRSSVPRVWQKQKEHQEAQFILLPFGRRSLIIP